MGTQLNPTKIVSLFMLLVAGVQLFNFLRTMKVRLQGGTTIYRHERPYCFGLWLESVAGEYSFRCGSFIIYRPGLADLR